MKRDFIHTILSFTLVGLLFAGCSLEETPTSFTNSDNFYKTESQCIAALNSCYIPLKSIYQYNYLIATEGVTDLMWIASGTLDASLDISPSQPRFGQNMWTAGYKGVMYCNAAIAGIRRSPLTDEEKVPLLGEGMIMRAYYYWFLTSTFGDVPFYTIDVATDKELQQVAKLGRMPAVATRDSMIKDLLEYVPKMSQVRSNQVTDNRAGAAMGWMLIGKLAQWNKEWDIARDAMDKLEKIYGDLSQYKLEDVLLSKKNTDESIFEVQFTYSETGLKVTTSAACICTPSHGKGYMYDGVEIKELGNQMTTWTSLRPNQYYFLTLMPKNGVDNRTFINMAWSYNGINFNSTGTYPWLGPKFWCPGMINSSDGNNQKVFRYADALLMQAENYFELGNKGEAIRYLNMTRNRAGLPDYTFKNNDALLEEIQNERGRELLGEYQRKYDMVRWGIWYQKTYDYTDYSTLKNNMKPCHEYYPIPDTEVVYSGYNLDNKAYAAYGL
jgi:hypothetical protein